MAEAQAAFQTALNRIGFSQAAQAAVTAQGFVNVALLGLVTADQIKQVCKLIREDPNNPVTFNMLQQQMLLAFRFWVVNRQRLGLAVDAEEFTTITAFEQSQLMVRLQEDEAVADKETVAKMPDKFKQVKLIYIPPQYHYKNCDTIRQKLSPRDYSTLMITNKRIQFYYHFTSFFYSFDE